VRVKNESVELVIKIPEERYNEYRRIGDSRDILFEAIRAGILLPKGHGRLKDVDWIDSNCETHHSDKDGSWCYAWRDIDSAQTIIQADDDSHEQIEESLHCTSKEDAAVETDLLPATSHAKIGHWVKHNTGHSIYYDCSLCNCAAPSTDFADSVCWKLSKYCPDCGAKMEGAEGCRIVLVQNTYFA